MISIDGLAVEFSGTTLFSDISFVINEKDRIALMGKNGAGKSTLLKILAGVRQPTRGKVSAPKDCVVAYLPQHLMTEDGRTVFAETAQAFAHLHEMEARIDALNKELETRTDYESDSYMALIEEVSALSEKFYSIDATNYEEDVEKSLLGLGFTREDFQRQTSDFSGGWRMRIELAKLLLQKVTAMENLLVGIVYEAGGRVNYMFGHSDGVNADCREYCKKANEIFNGRGGGKPDFAQGSGSSTEDWQQKAHTLLM